MVVVGVGTGIPACSDRIAVSVRRPLLSRARRLATMLLFIQREARKRKARKRKARNNCIISILFVAWMQEK